MPLPRGLYLTHEKATSYVRACGVRDCFDVLAYVPQKKRGAGFYYSVEGLQLRMKQMGTPNVVKIIDVSPYLSASQRSRALGKAAS